MSQQSEFTQTINTDQELLLRWLESMLGRERMFPESPLPRERAETEGLLPWLAYQLNDSGTLDSLPEAQQEFLRDALRRFNMMHLACAAELERLAPSAQQAGIRFLTFKGHALARTLYPHPACRPTSDFDVLVDPREIDALESWLTEMGYAPTDPFAGTIWLGAQSRALAVDGKIRFHLDVHWDYTNRMYFRRRLGFDEIWGASREVACGKDSLRVPCPADNLVFACVHLAAFDPGLKVRLIWLLDIYLLMAALEEPEIKFLLERAGKARAVEACLVYGEMAAELGDAEQLEPVLEALRGVADDKRWRFYQRTLRNRLVDLVVYWGRLPGKDKILFFGDLGRWLGVRKRAKT